MNKVILLGRLTRDPEVRTTQSGKAVARIGLAVDRRIAKRRDASPDQQTADFINLVMWEQSADLAQRYLTKGSQILVEGRLQVRSYDDAQGQRRTVTEVVVDHFEFAGPKMAGGNAPGGAYPRQQAQPPAFQNPAGDMGDAFGSTYASPGFSPGADDDDVPF